MSFFRAFSVYAGQLDNVFLVALAEDERAGPRVEIMRAVSFDEQDRVLGLDTYSISTHFGATHHGGVLSWSVEPGFVTLKLSPKACRALGIDEGALEISVPRDKTDSIREWLAKIIDGAP